MDLFERVKLLVRSTLSGGLPEFAPHSSDPQKMLDTAEAKLDILRDDLARAEKKGNEELAARLKVEIADLEKLIAKARGKAQPAKTAPADQPIETTAKSVEPAKKEAPEVVEQPAPTSQETTQPADVIIDETRVADQLKKLREGK